MAVLIAVVKICGTLHAAIECLQDMGLWVEIETSVSAAGGLCVTQAWTWIYSAGLHRWTLLELELFSLALGPQEEE